jgi:chemotaxis protein histidine kinase CheA
MGLYIVKAFVEAHGGKIYVSSKVGEGSSFEIILPAQTLDNDEVRINNKVNKKASYSNVVMEPVNVEFSDIYSCIDYDYRKK